MSQLEGLCFLLITRERWPMSPRQAEGMGNVHLLIQVQTVGDAAAKS